MSLLNARASSTAALRAQALLRAWVCGDLQRLRAELDHSTLSTTPASHADLEQLELLQSIACRMKGRRDLYADRATDPQLGLCVDLLMHLAS